MEEQDSNQGPSVQIMPVENGFLITAQTGNNNSGDKDATEIFSSFMGSMSSGDEPMDPMAAIKKALDQTKVRSSTRRKSVEHHVAKTVDEAVGLVREILGTMKV